MVVMVVMMKLLPFIPDQTEKPHICEADYDDR